MLDHTEHPVSRWAAVLQINKSGYYAWCSGLKARNERNTNTKKRIMEEFEKSRRTYGSDRIVMELRKMGEKLGRRRCAAYMREMGLKSIHSRRRTRSLTDSRKARGDGYPNILRYECFPIVPRMGLVGDITYLRTGEGWARSAKSATPPAYGLRRDGFRKNHTVESHQPFVYTEFGTVA